MLLIDPPRSRHVPDTSYTPPPLQVGWHTIDVVVVVTYTVYAPNHTFSPPTWPVGLRRSSRRRRPAAASVALRVVTRLKLEPGARRRSLVRGPGWGPRVRALRGVLSSSPSSSSSGREKSAGKRGRRGGGTTAISDAQSSTLVGRRRERRRRSRGSGGRRGGWRWKTLRDRSRAEPPPFLLPCRTALQSSVSSVLRRRRRR